MASCIFAVTTMRPTKAKWMPASSSYVGNSASNDLQRYSCYSLALMLHFPTSIFIVTNGNQRQERSRSLEPRAALVGVAGCPGRRRNLHRTSKPPDRGSAVGFFGDHHSAADTNDDLAFHKLLPA